MNIYTLSEKELRNEISAVVAKAEEKTSGEVLPVIVSESDDYPGAQWRIGIFTGIAATLAYSLFIPDHPPYFYIAMSIPFIILGRVLGQIGFFKRLALFPDEVEEETFERALREFSLHKVSMTRKRTGILIYMSLLERRIILLADEGINAKVPENTWKAIVDELTAQVKKKEIVGGLSRAILRCGEVLREHFPAEKGGNPNELPNRLIVKV